MTPKNVLNLGIKELRGLWRDRMMLALIIYAFSLQIYTIATAMPDVLANAAIAIVDEDQSHLSTRIASAFYPPWFSEPRMITPDQMDPRMDAGEDTFALHIPPEFERDVLAGKAPAIQLNVDATRMTQAFSGSVYVQQIVAGEVGEFVAGHREEPAMPVDLVLRARYNPGLDPAWFGAVSGLIESITMLALVLTGAALIREKEHGTLEHLLTMPVTATEILLSKVWSMGLVVLLGTTFALVVVVQMMLKVPVQGSVPLFIAGSALMVFAMTALGIFMATVAGSMPQFALLMMLVLLPLEILSGAVTPRESMPQIIQILTLASPNTHFILLSEGILFRGAGLDVVWPQLVALATIGLVLFWLALARFRRFMQ